MTVHDIPNWWADRFGLATAPLFEANETSVPGNHHVLLDGGHGSFALSVCGERIWKKGHSLDWSWSCNLPHHVTVTDKEVAVVRWDRQNPELFSRSSVESNINAFYGYLRTDRVKSNLRVVNYMVEIFRRVRSLVANARIADDRSIDAYLAFLARVIERSRDSNAELVTDTISHSEGEDILSSLSQHGVNELFHSIASWQKLDLPVNFIPLLAVRHAGSEIFQEAHFEFLRAPAPDLLGYVGPAESKRVTRGGAHFTPPALARSIAEQALYQLPDLANRDHLVILDPACGSGAFLYEALRTLRRTEFGGHVSIIGRDISRPAVSMAKFVLENALTDWTPPGGYKIEVKQGDSLALPFPSADLILMNPPFISWFALTKEQQQQMQVVLGPQLIRRADFSMAFVTRALEALRPKGVMGTLLPGSLLSLEAASKWRLDILDKADLRFIASLGEYGLFTHAQVQVAAAIFAKPYSKTVQNESVTALISRNNADATGNALRMLRHVQHSDHTSLDDEDWCLFQTTNAKLKSASTWRLISNRTEKALDYILESGRAVLIDEFFDVYQGVLTGQNSVFILTGTQVESLPSSERKWFRPAIMNQTIADGQIDSKYFVFYPYNQDGLALVNEKKLIRTLPNYYRHYLEPNRPSLERRAGIANRSDWWGLSRHRTWALDTRPRLISKYFGGPGSFVMDFDANYIVVQGFAWFPKWNLLGEQSESKQINSDLSIREILAAYAVILNSHPFCRLLSLFSPHVAGGQFNFSPRFVNRIPIPNILALASDEQSGDVVIQAANLALRKKWTNSEWYSAIDHLTTILYGGEIFDQI